MARILLILGAFLILEGIPYFAFPVKARQWAAAMQEVPVRTLRAVGLISMGLGLVLLYAVTYF